MTSGALPHDREAAAVIQARLGVLRPSVGIVLGSGLGGLTMRLGAPIRIPYADIPHFPLPTVAGHGGELIAGLLGDTPVLVQTGRFHMYEGHSAERSALAIRTFAALGVETVVLTNAAGGVHRGSVPGTLMLIADHLNLTGRNPLVGPVQAGEVRFPDTSNMYDAVLRAHAYEAARRRGIALQEGIYAGVLGPSYETPAEIRMLERLGADAVGMSTVMEAIAACACGLRCLGISVIANFASGVSTVRLAHEDVLVAAETAVSQLGELLEELIPTMPAPGPRHG